MVMSDMTDQTETPERKKPDPKASKRAVDRVRDDIM